MGLAIFLQFSSQFLNFLSWPSFSLVYPLFGSIRAVKSDQHYQRCLAYWIVFSITAILESALAKLLIWLPFWPYAKGIVTLLLVTPYFDGASYVYSHCIRPYASMKLEVSDSLLIAETKNCILNKQDIFLDVAERHITVKREKEHVKSIIYQAETKSSYGSTGNSLTLPESPKRFQKEWSCAICLVSTTSQKCLRKHLQGKKHKVMEEELMKEEAVASSANDVLDSFNHITWVNLERLSGLLSPVARSIRWCTWKKPELGWTKLNTDGSVDRDNAGFGGLFRNYKGDSICAYVSKAPRHDIFLVELWAIWRGLVLAVDIGIRVIWVESDSLSVVNTINRKQPYGPKAHSCLKRIWDILKKFEKHRVTHSWRETNRAADHLAKMDLLGSDIVLWPKDFPNSLCKIIKDDAQGKRKLVTIYIGTRICLRVFSWTAKCRSALINELLGLYCSDPLGVAEQFLHELTAIPCKPKDNLTCF